MSDRTPERDSERFSSETPPAENPPTDDRAPETEGTDDLALTEDDVSRGPFRATQPRHGEEERFLESADGEAVDPVFREATPEVDVYEDLPSRRARAEPEEATEDAAAPEAAEAPGTPEPPATTDG
ncbi:hypothetical protein BH23GEM11_BH23GEM11_18030 [soil metagenome]